MGALSSNKKILITIGSFVVIILILVGVLKLVGSNNDDVDTLVSDETTTVADKNDDAGDVEDVGDVDDPDEVQTKANTAAETIPTFENDVSEAVVSSIIAYMSGQYYIDAVMDESGDETQITMAISGTNFQTSMDMDGMSVSILYLDGSIYFINDDSKQYIILSDILMDQVDIDFSELEEITDYLNLTQYNFTGFKQYTDSVNGDAADCYMYYNDDMSVIFYFVGDDLKRIDMGNGSGVATSTMYVNDFSPDVPAGMMTLQGLTKTTLMGFFGSSLYG